MKNIFFIAVIFVAVMIFSGCGNKVDEKAKIVFFYGQECSHCKVVEQYFKDNNILEKIDFSKKEVSRDASNASLMVERQKQCGLEEKFIGSVPFLWTEEKCFLGQDEIIQFFKDKINENK